jgi:hypothetical protein
MTASTVVPEDGTRTATDADAAPGADADLGADGPAPPADRWFERAGIAAYLLAVAAVVAAILVWLDGTLVYVIDDPAIHLSIADTLVRDGTWGVQAGSFQSASSSPVWTLLVAAATAVAPAGDQWVPLVLNVAAGLAVIVLVGRNQTLVRPGERRVDALAVAVLVVVALFLPGLAVVGMEHTLHAALVLAVAVLVQRAANDPAGRPGRAWRPGLVAALLVLATLTRFETAFLAFGLAAGLLADSVAAGDRGLVGAARRVVGRAALVTGSVGATLVAFAVVNVALGGAVLPNSVLDKSQGVGSTNGQQDGAGLIDIAGRFARDPLLSGLVMLAVTYVLLTWGRPAGRRVTAVALVVATALHSVFADMGWYERYQAYLIAVGVYVALGVLAEVPVAARRRGLAALVVLTCAFGATKVGLLAKAPHAADDMYRAQYQAGLFLDRYYRDQPVATDQLGYISLLHHGPITDLGGLADYEVLRNRPEDGPEVPAYLSQLADERGFRVAVLYGVGTLADVPPDWVLAGTLVLDGEPITGVSDEFMFWAVDPDEVEPLLQHLEDFAPTLPARVHLELNEFAGFQAAAAESAAEPGAEPVP